VVEIAGHQYRYGYDPDSKKTIYLGPIGDGPEISEEDFLAAILLGEGARGKVFDIGEGLVAKVADDRDAFYREKRAFDEFRGEPWIPKKVDYPVDTTGYGISRKLGFKVYDKVIVREKGDIVPLEAALGPDDETGAPLTMEELREVEEAVSYMWWKGYYLWDHLQIARRKDGSWFFFDMDGLRKKKDDEYWREDVEVSDFSMLSDHLYGLARANGVHKYQPQTRGFLEIRLRAYHDLAVNGPASEAEFWRNRARNDLERLKEMNYPIKSLGNIPEEIQ
jgi:hypothetical protein